MGNEGLSVGEMAAATGLSVRMLHHYDRLGLVSASARTAAGHRRYLPADVDRLYRVQALRGLGMSLRDAAEALAHSRSESLPELVARQLEQVRSDIADREALLRRLEQLRAGFAEGITAPDGDLISAIAAMTALDQDLQHDYREQSGRYDQTRGASPSILDPIASALAGAPGDRLIDVGGGTGNYAAALRDRGWRAVVVDVSPEMREQADSKGWRRSMATRRRCRCQTRAPTPS